MHFIEEIPKEFFLAFSNFHDCYNRTTASNKTPWRVCYNRIMTSYTVACTSSSHLAVGPSQPAVGPTHAEESESPIGPSQIFRLDVHSFVWPGNYIGVRLLYAVPCAWLIKSLILSSFELLVLFLLSQLLWWTGFFAFFFSA